MRAYVTSPIPARSIQRISSALAKHAPCEIVTDPKIADLVVHIVIGVGNFADTPIDQIIKKEIVNGQQYAIVQCCLMSTEEKKPDFWKPIWEGASSVWSYLDLKQFAPTYDFNFYHAPLGVDPIFNRSRNFDRDITMLTTGYVAESECIHEVAEAVRRVGGKHVHVGPNLCHYPESYCDVSDEEMACLYSRSQYVAGLRRDEGFELPAAEGLLCGARPIMFDAPHYTEWFRTHADYVSEDNFSVVTASIESLLRHTPYVSEAESLLAAKKFSWPMVVGQFWESITTSKELMTC